LVRIDFVRYLVTILGHSSIVLKLHFYGLRNHRRSGVTRGSRPGDTIQEVTPEWKKCGWIYKETGQHVVGR